MYEKTRVGKRKGAVSIEIEEDWPHRKKRIRKNISGGAFSETWYSAGPDTQAGTKCKFEWFGHQRGNKVTFDSSGPYKEKWAREEVIEIEEFGILQAPNRKLPK